MIAEFKTKESEKRNGFDFQQDGMYFHVRKAGTKFNLYVNNNLFVSGKVAVKEN